MATGCELCSPSTARRYYASRLHDSCRRQKLATQYHPMMQNSQDAEGDNFEKFVVRRQSYSTTACTTQLAEQLCCHVDCGLRPVESHALSQVCWQPELKNTCSNVDILLDFFRFPSIISSQSHLKSCPLVSHASHITAHMTSTSPLIISLCRSASHSSLVTLHCSLLLRTRSTNISDATSSPICSATTFAFPTHYPLLSVLHF